MSQSQRNERRRQVAYEVMQGWRSIASIAKTHDVSESNVRSSCKQFGIDIKKAKALLAERVASAIETGDTRVSVMSTFGVTAKFVSQACDKHNVLLDPIGNNSPKSFAILADLLNTSNPLTIIAARHKVSPSTVSKLYNMAIEKGFPIARRKQGQPISEPHPTLRIGICLDDAIDFEPDFFRNLTRRFSQYARVYIMASPTCGSIREVVRELEAMNITYHRVDVVHDRIEYIKENEIRVLFDDKDETISGLDASVLVMKPRTVGNFDFVTRKWIYTESTGEVV